MKSIFWDDKDVPSNGYYWVYTNIRGVEPCRIQDGNIYFLGTTVGHPACSSAINKIVVGEKINIPFLNDIIPNALYKRGIE